MTDDTQRETKDCRESYFEAMKEASEVNRVGLEYVRRMREPEDKA